MPSPNRFLSFLSWFMWSVAAWFALAGAAFGLVYNPDKGPIPPWHWWLALGLPFLAVLCGWRALRAGNAIGHLCGRLARVIFWIFALAGLALVALLLQGRLEVSALTDDHQVLVIAAFVPVVALILAVVMEWRAGGLKSAGFGWLIDIPIGIVCLLVLTGAAYFICVKTEVQPLRAKVAQSWVEIGHPMAEFEQSLQPVEENASLRDLTADLKPFGVVTLYKNLGNSNTIPQAESKQRAGNTIQTPPELMELYVGTATIQGDRIKNVPKAAAWLDAHADDLNRLEQGLLQRDPPEWSCNPADGFLVRLPDFVTAGKVAELICSDAYHRLQKNDTKGARDAISAGLRMVRNLGEQPLMVSNMTRANIEAMYAPVLARLPTEPGDMKQLSEEVTMNRRQFARSVQWEAWSVLHFMETGRHDLQDIHGNAQRLLPVQPLPAWLGNRLFPLYCQSLGLYYCSEDCLYQADVVRISERAPELAASDLGAGDMDASNVAHLTPFSPNWSHAWLRVNFTLLIREQADMIRYARAQMQAGKSGDLGAQQSAVVPGAKWMITGDTAKNEVSLKLTPFPLWAADNSVMGAGFFLVPLNGKRPWQLLPPAAQP